MKKMTDKHTKATVKNVYPGKKYSPINANIAATIFETKIKNIVQAEATKGETPINTNIGKMTNPPPSPRILARNPMRNPQNVRPIVFLKLNTTS